MPIPAFEIAIRRVRARAAAAALLLVAGCSAPDVARETAPRDLLQSHADAMAARREAIAAMPREARVRAAVAAFHPDVLEKRAALESALARDAAAAAYFSVDVDSGAVTAGGGSSRGSLELSFDVLGLLGVGRAPASEIVAHADVLFAAAELRERLFAATLETRRAILALSIVEAKDAALADDSAAIATAVSRTRRLHDRGWIGDGDAADVESIVAGIAGERAVATRDANALRDSIASATGFAVETLDDLAPPEAAGDAAQLPAGEPHPALARAIAAQSVAEARLRLAAAAVWPELRAGPAAEFDSDGTLLGAVVSLRIDDPRRIDADVREKRAERDLARARVLQSIADLERQAGVVGERLAIAQSASARASEGCAASNVAQESARARYFADPERVAEWSRMAAECVRSIATRSEREIDAMEAGIALERAGGGPFPPQPSARPQEGGP